MAKPICIIYFPDTYTSAGSDSHWIYEYMRVLNGEQSDGMVWKHEKHFAEYYWFCFYKSGIKAPEFKVFYEKDFEETKFEELKKIITDNIKKPEPAY